MLSMSTRAIRPKAAPNRMVSGTIVRCPRRDRSSMEGGDRRARPADEVGHDPGHEAGKEHRVLDAPEVEDLDAEEGARDRRAEHRGEPGPDPADDQATPVLVVEPEDVGEEARDGGADLGARPLLADRAAEGEGEAPWRGA